MDKITLKNGRTVGYYFKENAELRTVKEDYAVFIVPFDNEEQKQKLNKKNFCFADRCLGLEISISNWNFNMNKGKKQNFIISDDWTPKEIYHIAKSGFERDSRFAVDFGIWNQEIKDELLYNFIIMLKEKKYMATCCYIEDKLEGFNIWCLEKNGGKILLGSVSERYKNTGMAVYVYSNTIQHMKECGGKILFDNVFSSNLQSMNLHIALAGWGGRIKVKGYTDWYMKCKEETGEEK